MGVGGGKLKFYQRDFLLLFFKREGEIFVGWVFNSGFFLERFLSRRGFVVDSLFFIFLNCTVGQSCDTQIVKGQAMFMNRLEDKAQC